jgi:hypothetical protein
VIAIPANHALELGPELGTAAREPVLRHHEQAEAIARVEQLRRRRVVGAAVRVGAHGLELRQPQLVESVGHGRADAGVVLVVTGALDLERLVVEEEAAVRVPSEGSDAERGVVGVDGLA